MKKLSFFLFIALVIAGTLSANAQCAEYYVIPLPKEVKVDSANVFVLKNGMGVSFDKSLDRARGISPACLLPTPAKTGCIQRGPVVQSRPEELRLLQEASAAPEEVVRPAWCQLLQAVGIIARAQVSIQQAV